LSGVNGFPVYMLHSVSDGNKGWFWNNLSVPVAWFGTFLDGLDRLGATVLPVMEALSQQASKCLPPRTICLTFDDGYVDNFVHALPAMKRYGFRGDVLVCRDMSASGKASELRRLYMNREMVLSLSDEGWGIGNHTSTHTWYASSPRVTSFCFPGSKAHPWVIWNRFPELKPFLLSDDIWKEVVGTPVLEHGRSLNVIRYLPELDALDTLKEHYRETFSPTDQPAGSELARFIHSYAPDGIPGRFENHTERKMRLISEIIGNRDYLEELTGKTHRLICFPGGRLNEEVLAIAHDSHDVGFYPSTGVPSIWPDGFPAVHRRGLRNRMRFRTGRCWVAFPPLIAARLAVVRSDSLFSSLQILVKMLMLVRGKRTMPVLKAK